MIQFEKKKNKKMDILLKFNAEQFCAFEWNIKK